MDANQLKTDVVAGRISAESLVDLLARSQEELQATRQQLQATREQLEATHEQLQDAHRRIEELEKKIGGSGTAKIDQPFSMKAEEKRQEARGEKKRQKKLKGRRGRLTTAEKLAHAQRIDKVYPEGVDPALCKLSHVRPVWRMEDGRSILVAYEIYRGPGNSYGKIPGVLGRSEFGLEIVLSIAYLIHVIGLSFDKVCAILQFLQNLPLKKSQADTVLRQLSRHWEKEFDALCLLAANSAIVHADETSWSINSVWAFLSEKSRLFLFGVHKDAETLKLILDPATFEGIVISDNAAVYAHFNKAQKCWAHLIRKAIKLSLQEPTNQKYRRLTNELVAIYREACHVQAETLEDVARQAKVTRLENRIFELCGAPWMHNDGPIEGLENDYRLLTSEIVDLALHQELFTFVTESAATQPNGQEMPVPGTNNEAERGLRPSSEARKTGRTNKSTSGCRRRSIITSVLESLRLYVKRFTLRDVIAEIQDWAKVGESCFQKLLKELGLQLPEKSILDQLLPNPSG